MRPEFTAMAPDDHCRVCGSPDVNLNGQCYGHGVGETTSDSRQLADDCAAIAIDMPDMSQESVLRALNHAWMRGLAHGQKVDKR